MKAEADHAGGSGAALSGAAFSDDRRAASSRAHLVCGSVLGDPPGDGGMANMRALLGRVRAIQSDHLPQHHSYHPTHHDSADYEDRMDNSGDYERPRWGGSGSRISAHAQPPPSMSGSYHEQKCHHSDCHHPDQYPIRHHPHHHHYQPPDQHRQYLYGRGDDDDLRHDPHPRNERAYPRGGYEDGDRREYADAGGRNPTTRPSSAEYHRRHQLPPARDDEYRSRPPPPPRGYDHSSQGPPDPLAYAYAPPVSRRVGAWKEEAAEESGEQYAYHAAAPAVDASYPPRSYAPPLLENLPRRRMANPASPASHHRARQSAYDDRRDDQYQRGSRDERAIVRDEPRSPPRLKARRSAANHESSSYQSTSNSSALSFVSNDDDDDGEGVEVAYRDGDNDYDDDDEEYDDDDAEVSDDEPETQTVRLSDLTPEMYKDHELHSEFRHALHMIIPANAFGCLIGNRGAIIRKINAQTQCTLSIRDPDVFSVKDDRVLRIYGKAKGICLAQHLVIEKIRAHRIKKQDPNYMPLLENGADLHELMLPALPESSITKCMNDSLVVSPAPNNPRQKKSSNGSASGYANGTLKWLVPTESVGKVMGTGGAILAGIARDTCTKIHITPSHEMPRGSKERKVTIFGSLENIEAARQVIEKKAGGRAESPGFNSNCGQYFAIPYSTAGSLIGIKGTRVRKITEKTGARLQIPSPENLPLGSLNRTLHIQGNRKQVEAAYALACSIVRKELEQLAAENRLEATLADVELTMKIILPVHISSLLLEQHGRLIREISEKSDAHAHFLPPCDDETRICVIKGEMSAVFRAERLVLQFVAGDTIATKRGGVGSQGVAPREKRKWRVTDSDDDDDDEDNDDQYDDDYYEEPTTPRGVRSVHQGGAKRGRPNERAQMPSNANGRRAQLGDNPGNRRVKMVARLNGRPIGRAMTASSNTRPPLNQRTHPGRQNGNTHDSRGAGDKEPDIIDRLQAPLQSARSGGNANKRQRR